MTPTITITEEAQAFFERNPDAKLRELVDRAAKEYAEFMGGLPLVIDAFDEEDADRVQVVVGVDADASKGSLRDRHHEFMKGWRGGHSREERRAVGFSIRYF